MSIRPAITFHTRGDFTAQFTAFLDGAVEAVLFSTTAGDENGNTHLADDLEPPDHEHTALRGVLAYYARGFFFAHYKDLLQAADVLGDFQHVGHDFWLTTQHHGAGFWDRGLGTIGDRLTEACQGLEDMLDLYVTDTGLLAVDTYNVTELSDQLVLTKGA